MDLFHLRLEKRLGVKHRFSDIARYREHIALLEAFHTVAEAAWRPQIEIALSDFEARRKAPLLFADLEAIGGRRIKGAPVPSVSMPPRHWASSTCSKGKCRRTASAPGGAGQARPFRQVRRLVLRRLRFRSQSHVDAILRSCRSSMQNPRWNQSAVAAPSEPFWRWKCGFAARILTAERYRMKAENRGIGF